MRDRARERPESPLLALQGEWTLADLAALPDDGRRFEVLDGALLVVNPPTTDHDYVVKRLQQVLDPILPVGYEAFGPVGLQLGRTVRGSPTSSSPAAR